MNISSRTPEGQPNRCPLCGNAVHVEPSQPTLDAPCPHCGHLLHFVRSPEDSSFAYFFSSGFDADKVPPYAFELMPISVGIENGAVPIDKIGDLLVVASVAPISHQVIEKLQFVLNCQVRNVQVTSKEFESLRRRFLESTSR